MRKYIKDVTNNLIQCNGLDVAHKKLQRREFLVSTHKVLMESIKKWKGPTLGYILDKIEGGDMALKKGEEVEQLVNDAIGTRQYMQQYTASALTFIIDNRLSGKFPTLCPVYRFGEITLFDLIDSATIDPQVFI